MSSWPKLRAWRGYYNMGRPPYPPLPMWNVMEDRDTGTRYVLTYTGDPGSLVLSLSTSLPTRNVASYGPFEGPWLNGTVRLYIASGALAGEVIYPRPGNWNPRVFARQGNERLLLEVLSDAEGNLSYAEVEVPT